MYCIIIDRTFFGFKAELLTDFFDSFGVFTPTEYQKSDKEDLFRWSLTPPEL